MKKRLTSFISLLLCVGIAFTLVGCGENVQPTEERGEVVDLTVRQNKYVIEEVSDSDIVFYQNGVSPYKIVVPAGKLGKKAAEGYAAEEIQFFVKDASGITLPIITDEGITYNENDKYISLGNTTIFNGSEMAGTLDKTILRNDGFKIATYGSLIVMNSCGENGMLYTAYGFLQRIMDLEYYAEDVWTMTDSDVVYIKNMNVLDVPDFQQRHINTGASDDAEYTLRLRQHGFQSIWLSVGEGPGWTGSDMSISQQILVYDTYYEEHKSWFNWHDASKIFDYGGQPCLSAIMHNYVGDEIYEEDTQEIYSPSTGVRAKYTEYEGPEFKLPTFDGTDSQNKGALDTYFSKVVQWIAERDDARIYMIGGNDNEKGCQCARCLEQYKTVKESGQYVIFVNMISDLYEEWQDSLKPGDKYYDQKDRYMEFAFFAYYFAEEPPTNYNPITKEYTPVNDDVICKDNVVVRIAPIRSVNMHLHTEAKYNPDAAESFSGWPAVSKKFAVWDYGCNFEDAVVPYADWGTIKGNFMMYRDIGVSEIFTQLQSRTSGFGLRAYKMYLRSELMWNVDQDFYELTENFFMNYYGEDAGPILLEYLYFLQAVYQTFDVKEIDSGDIYSKKLSTPEAWSYFHTRKMGTFFDEAIDSISHLQSSDPALYEKYYKHIKCESLFYMYLLLKNYTTYMTKDECVQLCDEFEYWRLVAGLRLRRVLGDTSFNGWVDEIKAKL